MSDKSKAPKQEKKQPIFNCLYKDFQKNFVFFYRMFSLRDFERDDEGSDSEEEGQAFYAGGSETRFF